MIAIPEPLSQSCAPSVLTPRWASGLSLDAFLAQDPTSAQFDAIERASLLPLPREPVVWRRAKVHADAHIALDRRLYSVPWTLIGQRVWAKASAHSVVIYANDERVATHDRRGPGPRSTHESHLSAQRAELRHRGRRFWEEDADAMGEEVGSYIRAVFDSDEALSQLRAVQAMVSHLETFPVERAGGLAVAPITSRATVTAPSRTSCAAASTWSCSPRAGR